MADIQLEPGETLIGQGMMAYWEPVLGSSCNVWRGTIFVTNKRVCFRISWTRWQHRCGYCRNNLMPPLSCDPKYYRL